MEELIPLFQRGVPKGTGCSILSEGCHLKADGVFHSLKGCQLKADGVVHWKNLPYNPKLKQNARELRKAGNLSEVLFWQRVKNKQFCNLDFDRQKIIGDYIVDFFCRNLGFVLEIDGESHDFEGDYDEERDKYFKSLGLKVFHIQDKDIKRDLDSVMKWLEQEIGNSRSADADSPLKEGNTPSLSGHPSERGE